MSSHNDNLTQAVSIEVLLSGLVSESLDPLVHCSAIKIPWNSLQLQTSLEFLCPAEFLEVLLTRLSLVYTSIVTDTRPLLKGIESHDLQKNDNKH